MGDGVYTEYTLLIYLSGSGSPAAQGKQKGVTKPSPGLLGGETIFYGNHLLGSEQFNVFLHAQSLHKTESSNAGKMLCLKCCSIAALQAWVPCCNAMSCLWRFTVILRSVDHVGIAHAKGQHIHESTSNDS